MHRRHNQNQSNTISPSWQLTVKLTAALALLIGCALWLSAVSSASAQDVQVNQPGSESKNLAPVEYWKIRRPHAGDPAPPLALAQIYDRPANIPDPASFSWKDHRGRVAVVEFSASWCAPCIALIPHMNELVTAFEGKPVTFMTISNESDEDIAKFRAKHPMKGLFGRDLNNATHNNYWIAAVPAVAIVDAQGKVVALTHPSRVTKEVLLDVLAGKPVNLPTRPVQRETVSLGGNRPSQEKSGGTSAPLTGGATATLSEVERVPYLRSAVNPTTGEIKLTGPPKELVAFAFDAPPHAVDYKAPVPTDRSYEVYIKPIDSKLETGKRMLRQLLETNLSLKIVTERRPQAAKLLRRVPGSPPPEESKDTIMRSSYQGGVFSARNVSMSYLINFLTKSFSKTVVDETGLKGKYNIELNWNESGGTDAILTALKKIGFELIDGESQVEFVTVNAAK